MLATTPPPPAFAALTCGGEPSTCSHTYTPQIQSRPRRTPAPGPAPETAARRCCCRSRPRCARQRGAAACPPLRSEPASFGGPCHLPRPRCCATRPQTLPAVSTKQTGTSGHGLSSEKQHLCVRSPHLPAPPYASDARAQRHLLHDCTVCERGGRWGGQSEGGRVGRGTRRPTVTAFP
jgi:hypothetical protein